MCEKMIDFIFPINGDCLNIHDGKADEYGGISIKVTVKADDGADVYINGKKASLEDGLFSADITVRDRCSSLIAEDKNSGASSEITVFYLRDSDRKYRLSLDDNILFLQDINEKRDVYTSIFDNPYLAICKKAHDLYDTKVHINLFYEFKPEEAQFSDENRKYFNLSMMTDKFKNEFRANSDWMKFSFHSNSEFPDKPYEKTPAERIAKDCLRVNREIIRFAGEEALNNAATIHWGEVSREGVRALRELGVQALAGYFEKNDNGEPLFAYYADDELQEHIGARDFWIDTDIDMLFARIDLVLNLKTADWVKKTLEEITLDPHRGGFVSIMMHEQYFYKDYVNYLSDFEERTLSSCKYLFDKGYRGAHFCEI